jgi:two-component sensor histidine kinase
MLSPTMKTETISITLEKDIRDQLVLTGNDSGIGLTPEVDLVNGKSLGLLTMNGLAAQLWGELSWTKQPKGTGVG